MASTSHLTLAQMILTAALACGMSIAFGAGTVEVAGRLAPAEALSARNYLQKMSPGLNLGNTLEALPTATSWGNPPPTLAYFQAIRSAGFKSVRIPVAWSQYADASHRIDSKWMSHVTEVARMANRAGLYAMINIHWDGGWLQPTGAKKEAVNAKFARFWTQIATNFRGFDDRLLLAGTNEVHVEGDYGPPSPENATIQNGFNQIFVDAVRASGGKNKARFLVVQGYNTDIDHTLKVNGVLPRDTTKGRLMMEVHFYSPYNFTLNGRSDIWQWGARATDPEATETWANGAYIDAQFEKMRTAFVAKGVPVILGEYGAGLKTKYPGMRPYRNEWNRFVTRSAHRHGLVPMYWDIGLETGLFHRTTGARQDRDLIKMIVEAAR